MIQTVHSFLPPSYFYQRNSAGVDSTIFKSWAEPFLEETAALRSNDKHIALIFDGYSSHIQLDVLQLFQDNRVHAVALPSHSSHVLQPLDVTVFSPFKSVIQSELHSVSRHTRCIDVFTAASVIKAAYNSAITSRNIVRGFGATGLWVREARGPSLSPLTKLFRRNGQSVSVEELMSSFLSLIHI